MPELITIDKTHPMPRGHQCAKYPFGDMGIGHSFFTKVVSSRSRNAAYSWARNHPGVKFSIRKEGDGSRVYRIA